MLKNHVFTLDICKSLRFNLPAKMNVYNFEINNVTNFSILGTEGSKFQNPVEPKMPSGHVSFSSTSETPSQALSQTQPVINQEIVERATIKVWNVSGALSEEFFRKFFTAADESSIVKKVDDSYVVEIAKDKANLIIEKLNNWEVGDTILKASIIDKPSSLQVRVWNLSPLIPEQFFMEFFKYLKSESIVKKFDDHYIVEVPRDVAEMIVHKLNMCYLVDTNLRACIVGEEDFVVTTDRKQTEIVSSIYLYCYFSKKLEFGECLKSAYGKVLKSRNYKTVECSGDCSGALNVCMFYHNINDKRRSLDTHRYTHEMCPYPKITFNVCGHGDSCTYSHTLYEQMFHPTNIHTVICSSVDESQCQKQPFCKFSHKNSPEMFYNENWCHLLTHGVSNTFKFFVGAINEMGKIPSNYDVKICLVSRCQELLDMADKCVADVTQALRIKSVILDTNWVNTDQYQVFLGTPDVIANYHGNLLKGDVHGALIIDGIAQILEDSESRMNVRRIIQKLGVNQNSKVNMVCVSNFYDPEISHYLLKTFGLIFTDIGPHVVDPYYPVRNKLAEILPQKTSEPKKMYGPGKNSQEVPSSSITAEKRSTSRTKRSRSKSHDRDSDQLRSSSIKKRSRSKSFDRDLGRQRSSSSVKKRSRSKSRDRNLNRQLLASSVKRSRSKSRDREDRLRSSSSIKKRSRSKSHDRKGGQRLSSAVKRSRSKSHDCEDRLRSSSSIKKRSRSKSRDRKRHTLSTSISRHETEVKKESNLSDGSLEKSKSKKLKDKPDKEDKEKETSGGQHNSSLGSEKSKCQINKSSDVHENKNSDVDANLKIILGEELYRSFVLEKTEIQKSHEKEFDAYITFPELHSRYNILYSEFLEDFSQKHSGVQSETRKILLWNEFWKTRLRFIMDEDWERRKNELFLKYRNKIESKVKTESKTSDNVLNQVETNSTKIESDEKNYKSDSKDEKSLKKVKSYSSKTKPKIQKLKIEWNKPESKKVESATKYDNLKKYQSNKYENINNNNKIENELKNYVNYSKKHENITKFVNNERNLKVGSKRSSTDLKKSVTNSKIYESYRKFDKLSRSDVKKDQKNSKKGDVTESKNLKGTTYTSERYKFKKPPDMPSEAPKEKKSSDLVRQVVKTASEVVVTSAFTVEKALDLLENFSSRLGIIGPSIMAMVKSVKDLGCDSEALQIFLDGDNISLMNMVISKFESLQKSPSEDGVALSRAINWIKQLLEHAKNPPKKSASLDVEQIAKSCLGKSPSFIVGKIKEALANDPSGTITKDNVNEIFLKVCDLQFKLQM